MSRQLVLVGFILAISSPASAAPAWCATEGATPVDGTPYELDAALKSDDAREAIKSLVGLTCYPRSDVEPARGKIDAARARWSQRLAMTEADWGDAAMWASGTQGQRMQNVIYIDTQGQQVDIGESLKRAWSTFGPLDQYAAISRGVGDNLGNDKHYVADAFGANLTEVGRLAYIEACLATTDAQIVRWAMCEGDIAALDRKKLAAEVRAERARTGRDRMAIRIRLDRMDQALAAHRTAVKAAIAKDPAYGKMFELAAATRTEWTARWKNDAALIALVQQMDDARSKDSKKAYAGCEDPTQNALDAAVGTITTKRFEGALDDVQNPFVTQLMAAVVATPSGYLAGAAYYLCRTRPGSAPDLVTRALGAAMQKWPGHRGPRSATLTAIYMAGLELDTGSAQIEYPSLSRDVFHGRGMRSTAGTIAKLTSEGATVTLTWTTKLATGWKCTKYSETRKVVQIRDDGYLVYESTCLSGKEVTYDVTPRPATIAARYATGLAPGMNVLVAEDTVVAAYKKGAKIPSLLLGVAVK